MESIELIDIWKVQNAKIDKAIAINEFILKDTIEQRAKKSLKSLIRLKIAGIISFTIYISLLCTLLYFSLVNYSSALNYFIFSVSAIVLINLKGFFDYVKHLIWTLTIKYDGTILEIQQQLSKLQLSIINHGKIMVLQFPFFTTFYLSDKWFPQEVGLSYYIFQFILTGAFTLLSYWLYKNHKLESLSKRWFRILISGSGGKSVSKAITFYKELEEFKKTS